MNIKNRIKVSISNIPKAVKSIPGIQDSLITRYGKENNLYGKRGSKSPRSVVTKEVHTCIMYLHRLGYNKRSLSRILLLHPNTINRVLNKPQDYEY